MSKSKKAFITSNAIISGCLFFLASIFLGFSQASQSTQDFILAIVIYAIGVITLLLDVFVPQNSSKSRLLYMITLIVATVATCASGVLFIINVMSYGNNMYLIVPIICIVLSIVTLIFGIVLANPSGMVSTGKVFKAITAIVLVILFSANMYFSVTSITSNYDRAANEGGFGSFISSIFK